MGKDGSFGFKNEKGTYIKVQEDKKGIVHVGVYDKRPDDPTHKTIHINVDTNNKTYTTNDNTSGKNEPSSGGCFLTTACMRYYKNNFDDNCYELTKLRWFRDNFVSEEDIKHYYTLAPIIVDEINKLDNSEDIYKNIYENVIVTCIKYMQNLDYKRTYEVYKKCILELEEKYVRPVLNQRLLDVLRKKRDLLYIKEVCNNGEKVVESLEKEQKENYIYRLVLPKYSGENVNISDKNIENNSIFMGNLFD